MEQTFSFERGGNHYTLPFNPEIEGYLYKECKCAYVKFVKKTGENETQLNFYYKSSIKYVQVLIVHRDGERMRQLSNKNVQFYPSNQQEFNELLTKI